MPNEVSAGGVVDQARQAAMSQLEGQKTRAAQTVGGMAESLHQAGRSMDGSSQPVAQYVHQAADRLDGLSRALNDKPAEELIADAEAFARRQPALFLGLAFAAGLAAARFLKSSSRTTTMADRVRETVASATEGPTTPTPEPRRYSEPVAGQPGGW